jgi:hypothetical protein
MTNLSDRRKLALANPEPTSSLQLMRSAYEAGFGKSSEIKSWGDCSFTSVRVPVDDGEGVLEGVKFDHRETYANGFTSQEALANWRDKMDKCPQSGKELIWRVPPEIDCYCDFQSDKLIWKVYARMIIIPEDGTMTDITRKLEMIAVLKSGEWEWGKLLSTCAEALAEIHRLRAHERASERWLAELMPVTDAEKAFIAYGTAYPEPAPEPWGSTFAMNTENWI